MRCANGRNADGDREGRYDIDYGKTDSHTVCKPIAPTQKLDVYFPESGEGPFPVYEYGADGEPLLVAETIRVIEQLDPQTLRPA